VAVPLEVQVPQQMEIVNERPTSVEVTMRGAAFSNMWFGQPLPACIIDLQGAQEGEHTISLTPDNVKTPRGSGIEVLQVNPVRVTLVLEKTISKEVPVNVPVRGEPAQGFEIYGRSSKPATAIVTGPRSHIDPLREISAEPVSIGGLNQSARFFVGLNIRDNAIRTSSANPVQVDIQIGPRRKLVTLGQVPLATDDPAYTVSPRQIAVQVLGPADSVEGLTPADFSAVVLTKSLDFSKLPVKAKPQVTIMSNPAGALVIKDVTPTEVTVRKKLKQ
jgi:YbbR domain-containing protein